MNQEIFSAVQAELDSLKTKIEQGAYKGYKGLSPTDGWGGAGIGFSTVSVDLGKPGFYPDPRIVVTPYAHACGWLLDRLRDIFFEAQLIDSCSKIEFFGRLAQAAQRYQTALHGKSEKVEGMLHKIHGEARQILAEMRQGTFEYLILAFGNTLAEDLK